MGFFNQNYSAAGPGISKEQAEKRNYFDILKRKFWELIKLNLLFAACMLPIVAISFLLTLSYGGIKEILEAVALSIKNGRVMLIPVLPFLPWIFAGPLTAGLTYVLRCYSRQEHAFVVSDFFEYTKKNFKQGLLAGFIQTLIIYLFLTALLFYIRVIPLPIFAPIALFIMLLLVNMSYYIFPIMITFDMKIADIYKNSLIFSMAKFLRNIIITIVVYGINIYLAWNFSVIWAVLMAIILIAWSDFTITYYVWDVIEQYMLKKEDEEEKGDVA